jgi:hypothetical protein
MQRAQGFAEQGARVVWTAGIHSVTLVQESAPFATITVYLNGTTTLATLFSDNQTPPTPMANPFTANENGYWFFYAPDGCYDVMIRAEEWVWTIGDLCLQDLYSWGKDVQANGHSLLGVGTVQTNLLIANTAQINSLTAGTAQIASLHANSLTADAAQIGSLQANSITSPSITSPSFHVQNCITFENPAGRMSICIDSNASLVISDASQTVMLIDQQGHVGIGTVVPQSQLEVGGTIRVTGQSDIPASGSGLELVYQPSPQLGIVQAYDRTAHAWLPIVMDASLVQLNSNTGGNVTMCLAGGNVGVRVPAPLAVFEAAGTIRITDDLPVPGPGQGLELAYQRPSPTTGALGIVQAYDRTAGQWLPLNIDGVDVDINSNTITGNVSFCRGGGNVGIGIAGAAGGWRLDVNGDINCSGQFRVNGVPITLGQALEARIAALEEKVK